MTLSMSAHCERGITQLATYVYIRGFSLTSAVCPYRAIVGIAAARANATNASAVFLNTVTHLVLHRLLTVGPNATVDHKVERGAKVRTWRIPPSASCVRATISQFSLGVKKG